MNLSLVEDVCIAEEEGTAHTSQGSTPRKEERIAPPSKDYKATCTETTPLVPDVHGNIFDGQIGEHSTRRTTKPSIFWLLPCLALFTIAYGATVVPKTNIQLSKVCEQYLLESNTELHGLPDAKNPQCRVPEVQSRTANFQLMVALITGALSAISSPKLGAASDGHGRLTMLAVSVCGTLLGELTFLLMALYPHIFHLNILLLGAAFDGITGAVTCVLALSTSYATDCVSAERRNVAFGYFHGVLFGGLALGPFLGGMIIKQTGNPLYLFYASMACYSIFLVFLVFIIPESLSKERQLENRMKHPVTFSFRKLVEELNPANFFRSLAIFSPKVSGSIDSKEKCILKAVKRNLFILAAVDTTVFGIKMGLSRIIIIYAEYLFGWGNVESSFFVSLISTVRVVMLLAALPAITRLVRGPKQGDQHVNTGCDMLDITIIRVSVFIDAAGYIGYACARTGSWLTVIGALEAIGAMISPTLQSSLTKHVSAHQTGQVLGAMGFLHALTTVIMPALFNFVYSQTVGTFPQAIFVCIMVLVMVSLALSFLLEPHVYVYKAEDPDGERGRSESESEYSDEATLIPGRN